MKTKVKNFSVKNVAFESSSLQGYLNDVTYKEIVSVFGSPNAESDGYKTDAEWEIKFDDGTYATIYNWKNGKNYCGKSGTPKTKITEWHIGGNNQKAVERIKEWFPSAKLA